MEALRPGDDCVVAVGSAAMAETERQEADVLNRLTSFARQVAVREGQAVSIDLELVQLP